MNHRTEPTTGTPWADLIPDQKGCLPSGEPVWRTEPAGPADAPVAFLGVYPAGQVRRSTVDGVTMNLPFRVERTSFEAISKSGKDLDVGYLDPLGLERASVFLFDLLPYFLINTRGSGGKTMWGNIQRYEELTKKKLGIEPRPDPRRMPYVARQMPGNLARLTDYINRARPRVLFTLGTEVAAFVRGESYQSVDKRAKSLFYSTPANLTVLGVPTTVVHLAHPGILMSGHPKAEEWRQRHDVWCGGQGRALATSASA